VAVECVVGLRPAQAGLPWPVFHRKNRMREICTFGSVREPAGNRLPYSASFQNVGVPCQTTTHPRSTGPASFEALALRIRPVFQLHVCPSSPCLRIHRRHRCPCSDIHDPNR
jgi:hypothetical protein